MAKLLAALALCALASQGWAGKDIQDKGSDLRVETFCWKGGTEVSRSTRLMKDDDDDDDPLPVQPERRLGAALQRHLDAPATEGRNLIDAIWDRPTWRQQRFNLTAEPGEHPCFAGFTSMMRDTDRCGGWRRQYPPVGGNVTFINTGISRYSSFQLLDVVADHINVWIEEGASDTHGTVAVKAAKIYANVLDVDELKPVPGSESWMAQECKVMGPLPFMYSCSDRINILVQDCGGVENAWVRQSDYLANFPGPSNNESGPNNDIVFYMCQELIDRNPNPYAAANTFAHELAHVIQGGFGSSFYPMTEGGATWLEGSLLRLAPRPMQYAWGFRDWNRINAAHLYATTKDLNARKFYQIHAMLLTYLSQEELLGDAATSALQNYQSFHGPYVPWGRGTYDYFLSYVGKSLPENFEPIVMDVESVQNPFATALLDFRVAIAAQCIVDPAKRPTEARYLMPAHLRDRPFWDCSSFRTFWSADPSAAVNEISDDLHYGGAAMYRLASPSGCTLRISENADERVRTKILAAGTASGSPAEIRELAPGEETTFGDEAREFFVVQVNVDPEGETLSAADQDPVWKRAPCRKAVKKCKGKAWTTASKGYYNNDVMSSLRSPLVELPEATNISLSFLAWWDLEAQEQSVPESAAGCPIKGYDGVQVRVHVYQGSSDKDGHSEGDEVLVLQPQGGYGVSPEGKVAIAALANPAIVKPYGTQSCGHLDGWTGRSPGRGFSRQEFSLSAQAGSTVRVEIVFASDPSQVRRGFWLDDLEMHADGNLLLSDDGEKGDTKLFEHVFVYSPEAGSRGKHDGVPVVVQYPEGYEADRNLEKAHITRSAPWSAQWDAVTEPEAALQRAYLGWSYSAPTYDTKTAVLHPWQEACVQLQAPFRGIPTTATLFTLVDKIGITSVSLTGRSSVAPYDVLAAEVKSPSPGVTDPGVHRFRLGETWPVLEADESFLLCVSSGDVKALPSDGDGGEAFLHLPLTNVSSSASRELPGWTVIRGADKNLTDPWAGHTMSLRMEYTEVVETGSQESSGGRRLRGASSAKPVLV